MKTRTKTILFFTALIFVISLQFFLKTEVYAETGEYNTGILPQHVIDDSVNIDDPQLEDLTLLALSVARFLIALVGGFTMLMICYGGFQYIISFTQGSEEGGTKAKSTIFHAIVGLIVVMGSYLMVTMFQSAMTSSSFN